MTPRKQRALIIGLISVGLLLVGFFGIRSLLSLREFRGHLPHFPPPPAVQAGQEIETDVELIREWMTIGFLSHTYQVPTNLLYDALKIPPRGNEMKSLEELNNEYFPDQPGYVLEIVKTTIQLHNAGSTSTPTASP